MNRLKVLLLELRHLPDSRWLSHLSRTCHGVPPPVLTTLFLLAPAASLISSCPPLLITLSCFTSSHISLSSDHLLKNEKNDPVFQLHFSSPSIFMPSVFLFQHFTVSHPLPFHSSLSCFSPCLHPAFSFVPHMASVALCYNTTRHCLKEFHTCIKKAELGLVGFSKIMQPSFALAEISLSLSHPHPPSLSTTLFLFNLYMMTAGHGFTTQRCHSSAALLTSNLQNSMCVFFYILRIKYH